eukprot:555071-Pleurochrysis_carterae.AAC.6
MGLAVSNWDMGATEYSNRLRCHRQAFTAYMLMKEYMRYPRGPIRCVRLAAMPVATSVKDQDICGAPAISRRGTASSGLYNFV